MLPSELLITRRWRNEIRPRFASINHENIALVQEIIDIYQKNVGNKKYVIQEKLFDLENLAFDYRFVRGVAVLVDRHCKFVSRTIVDPEELRTEIFQLASQKGFPTTSEARIEILNAVATKFGLTVEQVENFFYADLEDEKTLEKIEEIQPVTLLKKYNQSLTQTLLFYSTEVSFTASKNWQRIFRAIKLSGLIYTVTQQPNVITVKLDGPLSLFKLNRMYGVALAKVFPEMVKGKPWVITAQILHKRSNQLLTFELNSEKHGWLLPETPETETYDSVVESAFAAQFKGYRTPWTLKREPEPLPTGNYVLIPDFVFELGTTKVYMEIMGFWTGDYLKKKIEKLSAIKNIPFILAVDETLTCEKLSRLSGFNIIYYRNRVPLKPVLGVLKQYEQAETSRQSAEFQLKITRPIITVEQLASLAGYLRDTVIQNKEKITTHTLVGETFIKKEVLEEAGKTLESTIGDKEVSLTEALKILQSYQFPEPVAVLDFFRYKTTWKGINMNDALVKKAIKPFK